MRDIIISLYDYTGEAVRPWAEAGYTCVCFDIQHSRTSPVIDLNVGYGGGSILYLHADLHDREILSEIALQYRDRVAFLMAFPVCTDLAVSGAAHFENKVWNDPLVQEKAADHARWCSVVAESLGCPYFVENPVSRLATLWRKPDHTFHPYEYGGYIPLYQAKHPKWPEYIADRDAYPKKTCLWTGGGFRMPPKHPVDCPKGYSTQHKKLGGKSMKTKNIRSATPRGFARAVFEEHHTEIQMAKEDTL